MVPANAPARPKPRHTHIAAHIGATPHLGAYHTHHTRRTRAIGPLCDILSHEIEQVIDVKWLRDDIISSDLGSALV